MKFQVSVFALAAFAAQSAFAVPMDLATAKTKVASVAAENIVRISGASAVVLQVRAAVAKSCAGGIDAIFIPGTAAATPGGNNFAYVCTGAAGTTFDGQPFLVLHSVNGGSANSVLAMAASGVVPWIGKTQIAAAGCGATTVANTALDANVFGGCAASEAAPSHGGPSDVEASAFGTVLTPTANLQVATTSAGQGFGIIASEALYRAMSAAQGLPADCRDDTRSATPAANTRVIVGADDYSAACQPNITRAQYTALVTQTQAGTLGASADPWKVVGVSAPTENVNLCRRVATSGTQASSNVYFLGTNCAVHPLNNPSTFSDANGKYFVQENSGTGDALNCVNLGTKTGTPITVGSVSGNFRIGVVSLENKPAATASWNFLKLNGVSPTEDALQRASAIDGRYDFQFESAMHTDGVLTPANSASYLSGLALALGGDPADAGTVDVTGVYISPLGGFFNKDFATRVAKGTRDGSSCQPLREAFEAPPL